MKTPGQNRRVLIAGCGYVGLAAARRLHELGWEVTGLTQTEESARRLETEPFRVLACDLNDRTRLAALAAESPFDAVVDCVSSSRGDAAEIGRAHV